MCALVSTPLAHAYDRDVAPNVSTTTAECVTACCTARRYTTRLPETSASHETGANPVGVMMAVAVTPEGNTTPNVDVSTSTWPSVTTGTSRCVVDAIVAGNANTGNAHDTRVRVRAMTSVAVADVGASPTMKFPSYLHVVYTRTSLMYPRRSSASSCGATPPTTRVWLYPLRGTAYVEVRHAVPSTYAV